jgi:hypothetical protein
VLRLGLGLVEPLKELLGSLLLEGEVESPTADLIDSTTVMIVFAIWRRSGENARYWGRRRCEGPMDVALNKADYISQCLTHQTSAVGLLKTTAAIFNHIPSMSQ